MNPQTLDQTPADRLVRTLGTLGLLSLAALLVAVGIHLYA
jgi:hypothetical protein